MRNSTDIQWHGGKLTSVDGGALPSLYGMHSGEQVVVVSFFSFSLLIVGRWLLALV